MTKINGVRRSFVLVLAFLLILSQLNLSAFQVFAKEQDDEALSYDVHKELSNDKKTAHLKLTATAKKEQVTILKIETPDGKVKEGETADYTAEKNGSLDFIITYQDADVEEGQAPETKTYKANYDVTGIVTETEATKTNDETSKADETTKPAENNSASTTSKAPLKGLKAANDPTVEMSIPAYNQTAWANGDIKDVTVTVDFKDNSSTGKKINFTLPDGMRFVSIPVKSNYQPTSKIDPGVLSKLGASDPLGVAINSATVPDMETTYNKATFGTVSYDLSPGTEKVSFTFSVRIDAAKFYGTTDLKGSIKAEAYMGTSTTPFGSVEQAIHAEGGKVIGYANQDHVRTMFRNWYTSFSIEEVLASTATEESYNYTKPYSVVNGMNQLDSRGAKAYLPKNVTVSLYYPEGMEFAGVIDEYGSLMKNDSNKTITNYPNENKVVVDYKQLNYNGTTGSIFSVKYKVPEGTAVGTYSAPKVPHVVITTYDNEVFETDALTSNAANVSTLAAIDTCKVVATTVNKLNLKTGNQFINPDNETWAGSIQIDNVQTAGTKTNQVYHILFDTNWEAYTVNLPFDGARADNQITDIQYKTNLNSTYRTYTGIPPKSNGNRMAKLEATAVGLQAGEYFTEVKANVGDFSPGFLSYTISGIYRGDSTASYGIVKQGITSVNFQAEIWDADDEANTKASGVSTYRVNNTLTGAANGYATFYDKNGKSIKTARAGDTITTKASIVAFDYPYGTRTVLNDPEIYLRALDGTRILPSSIKLTNQDGEDVEFSVTPETANNGDKVYVLKTKDVSVGAYVGYLPKTQYLNVSYDTAINITLDKTINTDAQEMIAWGGPNVTSAIASNFFSDVGLDVNKNGVTDEKLLSVNSSPFSIPKQDTVTVETFLNVAGEGAKSAYVDGDDSTVSYFTPGTDADYTIQITNTSTDNASTFELYVPIPKTGQNFGSKFQNNAFKWDMKLNSLLNLTAAQKEQFDVSYATTATEENYETESIYSDTPTDLEKVNMVKIKVTSQIAAGETQTFKVPLKVDETFDSATSGKKIGERDIYNPYYRVITNTFSGTLPGTKVGAELIIAEIEGHLFEDKDANGLYEEEKGDTPIAGETVELYKWNETTSAYEPVLKDGKAVTSETNAKGEYSFNYNSGLGYEKYAVKFPNKAGFEYTLQNAGKNSEIDSDVANTGTDKGWVKEIDPTQPASQFISAGYINYTPNQDLKVNLNDKRVQAGSSLKVTLPKVVSTSGIAAEDTIEPAFFQNIQNTTDGYKWTSANTGVATVQTLSDGSAAIVGVATNGKSVAASDLTIGLKDIYGTEASSTAPVYVTATDGTIAQKDGFTIGATNFALEYKASQTLTEAQALNLAKTAAFEEVKNGVNSSAQDRTSLVKVNEAQLTAIQKGAKQGGTYPLTYTVTKDGKSAEVVIQVTVGKDLTTVNAHDSTIYVGDSWTASDNFDNALNKAGDAVKFADVQVTGTVSTNTAGTYPVTYTYNGVSTTVNVTVKDNLTAVNAHDSTIYTGDSWTAADNFDSALNKTGDSVVLANVTVTGTVDTTKAGTYTVTYSYAGISVPVTVTVKENKKGISAHDATIYVGDSWTATDNFDTAFDKDGNPVAFQDVKVTENPAVDTNKAGSYQVTYSYDGASKTITLTVKNIQTAVNTHDSTIYTGDSWTAADNFDSARDKDGNPVAFQDVTVSSTVDTDKAGTYPITYTYDGVSMIANITVKDPETAVTAHDSIVYVGDEWSAEDNFDSAKDKDGKAVAYEDVTVTGTSSVELTKPGVYQVTYTYDGVSTTINITVAPRQTSVTVHDSSIYEGETWNAKDNFDKATNKKGDAVSLKDVNVTGKVDTETPGTYEVSYLYDGVKVVAHVTVLENQAEIVVQDSAIYVGDSWTAEDNFIGATNREGKDIPFSHITVIGSVNTKKAGIYEVTYTFDPNEGTADAGKELLSITATIEVEEQPVDPVDPVDPSNPIDPGKSAKDPKSPIKVTDVKTHKANYKEAKPLPKTGDYSTSSIVWSGIFLLMIGMLLWRITSRRKHQ
ncbi:TPA_asm: cell surface protein [Listeria monocytogenes]|nr:cell surface protein [Listeria monocytogenes]